MTIYTQQINNMVEQLPVSEQQFIMELIKKISLNHSHSTKKVPDKKMSNTKQAILNFFEMVNSATDEVLDEEFDEIVKGDRNYFTRELDLWFTQ